MHIHLVFALCVDDIEILPDKTGMSKGESSKQHITQIGTGNLSKQRLSPTQILAYSQM